MLSPCSPRPWISGSLVPGGPPVTFVPTSTLIIRLCQVTKPSVSSLPPDSAGKEMEGG